MISKWTLFFVLLSLQNLRNPDAKDILEDSTELKGRIWQAGGSAEMAARGKCWIDGECFVGPSWWIGSHDDTEDSYRS